MANSLNTQPIVIDTDITSFRTAASVLQGIRVIKLMLVTGTGGTSTAGTVTITAPSDSVTLYPPIAVPGGQAARTQLYEDGNQIDSDVLTWRDFAVTGVTATGTVLYLWPRS